MKAARRKYNSSVLSWVAKTVANSINYFMHRIRGQGISAQKNFSLKSLNQSVKLIFVQESESD